MLDYSPPAPHKLGRVRICVIFNPVAKGEKARRFRRHLDEIANQCTLKLTRAPGDARRLAAEAVAEGCDTVVAAGGDGTLNEVLNGMGDVPHGFERARLAVLPLGTVNVFARELAIPLRFPLAWAAIQAGVETRIDLPRVEYGTPPQRRYFIQLAGAGIDSRAVELVRWELKKRLGPLAYVLAGFQALAGSVPMIRLELGTDTMNGAQIAIGNGRFYGGSFRVFPLADLRDGFLEVCVFPSVGWLTLARCAAPLLLGGTLPSSAIKVFRTPTLTLTSAVPLPLQADGELIGHLPAKFSIERERLRVIVPSPRGSGL